MSSRHLRSFLITLAIIAITFPTFFCRGPQDGPVVTNGASSKWLNVYDTSVHYVGMQTCRTCHEGIYETFIQTGMGQSFGLAIRKKSAGDFAKGHSLIYDKVLDYYYHPFWAGDSLYVLEYRLKGKDTVHKRMQRVDYIVGSGQHTNSHIYNINGYLYQVPVTFYTQKHTWDLAPGFEKGASSRFQRMIEIECMSCHNAYPNFVANSENKYVSVKFGIDCERCHGPGSLHVQQKEAGDIVDTSKGPDYTIVNPRRLPVELQTNVCERCHLQGIAVLNDNKTFFDFHPGMQLSEVMNVFMPEYEGAQDKMIMASHVERMKKSQCYIQSGKMTCITCHNPHISVKFTPRSQFLNACKSCHGNNVGQEKCNDDPLLRRAVGDDCVTCHMPHNGSVDIPHVAVTDHFIRKRPVEDTMKEQITAFLGLKCINNTHVNSITKARGYMEFYERYTDTHALLDSAMYYLNQEPALEAADEQNRDLIRVYFLLHDYARVTQYVQSLNPAVINDAWTAYRVGEAYYELHQPMKALPWYERSVQIWKYALDFENKYGACLIATGQPEKAMDVFNFIVNENPNYTSANTNLGYLYMQRGNNTMAYEYLTRAIALDPDGEQVLINLAVWYHANGQPEKARSSLDHLLLKHPENEQAKAMLVDLDK